MAIKVGDKVPSVTLRHLNEDGSVNAVSTDDYFKGKTVALFALPGAYTRTCSSRHLPGYVQSAAALKGKGIDEIACLSVNDAFVMGAWGREHNAGGKVTMLGDGSCEFTEAVGLTVDRREAGMGIRSQRYSMVVEDGVVKELNVEPSGEYGISSAEAMLAKR
ncbi:MAG: peroxiredoxin [Alphaproteobacteria bacterium]|nr:peroxiredoxin [Alphaproteobacteria bacterium]MBV9554091.1 peroxiredoxin [Alphaproteobacteria bacterium]